MKFYKIKFLIIFLINKVLDFFKLDLTINNFMSNRNYHIQMILKIIALKPQKNLIKNYYKKNCRLQLKTLFRINLIIFQKISIKILRIIALKPQKNLIKNYYKKNCRLQLKTLFRINLIIFQKIQIKIEIKFLKNSTQSNQMWKKQIQQKIINK